MKHTKAPKKNVKHETATTQETVSASLSTDYKENTVVKFLSTILLIAYGYVTVLTPNWQAFDSNASKFYTFAILNLIVAGIIFFVKDFREKNKVLFGFFSNKIGIAYCVIIFFALLSFTKMVNVEEGILHFFKIFTAFSAAWMVSALVIYNPKSVTALAIAMTLLLLYDVSVTIEGVKGIVRGKNSDYEIKGSYSNKNILASAMFIKIAFAIWLFYFRKDNWRILGGLGILAGTLAIFFMSTRAFYLATFIVLFMLIAYATISYFLLKQKETGIKVITHAVLVGIAFGMFSFVQNYMYPQAIRESTSFGARLAEVANQENSSNNLRKTAWTTTLTKMIVDDPLLGVGVGNWKVRYLEHENSYSHHYIYMYKNHNDFLETTAEIGIFGGLAFISIFLLAAFYFIYATYKNKSPEQEKWLFLPLLGLFAYSFDAFFNFPQDRPEIQSLFAIFVGIGVAFSVIYFTKEGKTFKINPNIIVLIAIFAVSVNFANVVVERMYFDSSKIQRKLKEEQLNTNLPKSPAAFFIAEYPKIPNLTAVAEPVDVEKARYLIDEKKFNEAREILRTIKYHPWDGRKEYFMAVSYFMEENKNFDSIYKYAHQAKLIKPNFWGNTNLEVFALNNLGREQESIQALKSFLHLEKDTISERQAWKKILKNRFKIDVDADGKRFARSEAQAWNSLAYLLEKNGMVSEAKSVLDTAIVYVPNDKTVVDNLSKMTSKLQFEEFMPLFNDGAAFFQQQRYGEAVAKLTAFLAKAPAHLEALRIRGISSFYTQQYKQGINDFNKIEELGGSLDANSNNFKASCYYMSGDRANAKIFYQKAASMGSADAQRNLSQLGF